MQPNVRELDHGRPGAISSANAALIGLACAVTLVVATAGPHMLWHFAGYVVDYETYGDYDHHSLAASDIRFWICNGLAIGFALMIVAAYLPRWSLARAVRVAVVLPIAHVLVLAAAWWVWPTVADRLPRLRETAPLVDALPMDRVVLGAGAACLAFGWLAAMRRRGEWVHGVVMLALATLFLVGMWLPIGAALVSPPATRNHWLESSILTEFARSFADPGPWIARMLVPPFIVALGFTIVALRRPDLLRRNRHWIVYTVGGLFVLALAMRFDPSYSAALAYVNFVHVLLALASVAVGSLGLLAVSLALRGARGRRLLAKDPRRLEGEIVDGDSVVALVEITSWLRGPRTWLRAFTVTTRAGATPIPSGAELVSALPAVTTQLETGERLGVLRRGDRVMIAGLVEPPANHPFRDSAALVPGTAGVYIARAGDRTGRFAGLALALWRPCVAYFTIVMAVALVGLVAALG